MDEAQRVAALDDVPSEGTLLFTVTREGGEEDGPAEVVLVRLADGVAAYRNYCQHWTDVRLDRGDGALVRNGEIWCQRHGATFERETGYCTFGPCEGAVLETVDVVVADGTVYLDDDRYAFSHLGGAGDDGDASSGRIGYSG